MKKMYFAGALIVLLSVSQGLLYGQTKETRDVKGFTKISFGISGDLFIKIGPEFKVVLEGDRDILDEIETEVSGSRLNIKKEDWHFNFHNERVTINITMPSLEGVGVSGSGKAQILDEIKAGDLYLNVSGSGKIVTSGITADNLDCSISGSGDVLLGSGGKIENGDLSISGSGGFSGEEIEITNLEVSISGSGNCRCRAGETLEAHVSGSGNVTYSGNPKVDARVSGSGHVRSK